MLNIYYGNMKESVYNTAAYFKYDYEDSWIVDPFVKEMIQDVDQSTVLDSGVIDSPVLGKIPPVGLSGGVKTLILVKFEKNKIFNKSQQEFSFLYRWEMNCRKQNACSVVRSVVYYNQSKGQK